MNLYPATWGFTTHAVSDRPPLGPYNGTTKTLCGAWLWLNDMRQGDPEQVTCETCLRLLGRDGKAKARQR